MKRISLALGGGGTKGFAHIGVIRQLEKSGFQIKAVSGTSAGGIVGCLYAYGIPTEEIESFSKSLKYSELFSRSSDDPPSLLGLGGLNKQLENILGDACFDQIKIPFGVTTVDIHSGDEIIINSGRLVDAAKATAAIPGIFPAMEIGHHTLVDGGVLDPVPVALARWLQPDLPVVAVSLTPQMEDWPKVPRIDIPPYVPIPQIIIDHLSQFRLGKAMHIFIDSMEIMINKITDLRLRLDKPDVIIRPKVHEYTMFDKVDIDHVIRLGEQAVLDALQDLKTINSPDKRLNRWFRVTKPPGKILKPDECLSRSDVGEDHH